MYGDYLPQTAYDANKKKRRRRGLCGKLCNFTMIFLMSTVISLGIANYMREGKKAIQILLDNEKLKSEQTSLQLAGVSGEKANLVKELQKQREQVATQGKLFAELKARESQLAEEVKSSRDREKQAQEFSQTKEAEVLALQKTVEEAGKAGEEKTVAALKEAQESYISCNKELETKIEELSVATTDLVTAQKRIKELEDDIAVGGAKLAQLHEELHDALTSEANHSLIPEEVETNHSRAHSSEATTESEGSTEAAIVPEASHGAADGGIKVSDEADQSLPPTEQLVDSEGLTEPGEIAALPSSAHEGGDDL